MRRWTFALVALASIASAACGSSAPPAGFTAADGGGAPASAEDAGGSISGNGGSFGDAAPADAGPCTEVIDVVFVLDVSSSMDFVLDQLGAQIDDVVTSANALAAGAHFGLIPFVDDYAFDTTGPLEGGKVHVDGATLKKAFAYAKSTYTDPNRNPGDGPNGPTMQNPICEEDALDALHAAAAEFPWRANATRVVILVTDDTFLERPDNYGDRDGDGKEDKTDYPREGNYPAKWTVAETESALQQGATRVFAFTRLTPPGPLDFTRCSTGRRLPWSSVSDGWSTPYGSNPPIPQATDGANFDLDAVKNGTLSLAETIKHVVVSSHCHPPPPK